MVSEVPGTLRRPRLDRERGCLLGSRCPTCGATAWPSRAVCHRCRAGMEISTPLATTGQLLSHTTVWVERAHLTPPYVIGQVRLDDGTLLFGHVRGVDGGARVPLRVRVVLAEEQAVPPFWFDAG
jgi:uncharacterized OB-fold protein